MGNLSAVSGCFRRHLPSLAMGVATLTFCNLIQMTFPRLTGWALDMLGDGGLGAPNLREPVFWLLGLALAVAILRFIWRQNIYGFSRLVERDLRELLFRRFVRLSLGWHQENSSGELMALATNDIEAVRMAVGYGFVSLVDAVVLGMAAVIFMLTISPALCLLAFIPLPLITLSAIYFSRRMFKRVMRTQNIFAELTETVREHIAGFKVIRAMGLESLARGEVRAKSRKLVRANVRLATVTGLFFPLLYLFTNISLAVTIFFGGRAVISGTLSAGGFVAFITYLTLITWPLMAMGITLGRLQQGLASLRRLSRVIGADEKPRHPEAEGDGAAVSGAGGALADKGGKINEAESGKEALGAKEAGAARLGGALPPAPGEKFSIEFKDVTFTYPGAERPAVSHLSFRLEPGSVTAVTGPTGSGKSTLASLLVALYEPDSGEILINGVPSSEYPLCTLRGLFGLVPQDGYIFSGTLFENIAFGKPEAAYEDVKKAAEAAQLFMDPGVFPDGLNTRVGEKGVTLSGGQRQRAALARALLTDAPFLILDDTLSAVDANVEEKILTSLERVRKGRGALIISHRLTTLSHSGRVIVIEDGRATQEGACGELSQTSGYFRRMRELAALSSEKEMLERRLDSQGAAGPAGARGEAPAGA